MLPQDVVVLAKLVSYGSARPALAQMASDLSLSTSQVHASIRRLERSRLVDAQTGRPILSAVEEFFVHAVKYVFPPERGESTRGIPTAHAAPPLAKRIVQSGPAPVWPDAEGTVRGLTLQPLHKIAPAASRRDPALYDLLTLVDAVRDGRARERKLAEKELAVRLRTLLRG